MTREEMIEALVHDIDTWDLTTLVGFVQHALKEQYSELSDPEIQAEYEFYFDDKPTEAA